MSISRILLRGTHERPQFERHPRDFWVFGYSAALLYLNKPASNPKPCITGGRQRTHHGGPASLQREADVSCVEGGGLNLLVFGTEGMEAKVRGNQYIISLALGIILEGIHSSVPY